MFLALVQTISLLIRAQVQVVSFQTLLLLSHIAVLQPNEF